MSFFGKIRDALKKTKDGVSQKMRQLFLKNKLGDAFYDELEEILISSDVSVRTAEDVVGQVREEAIAEKVRDEQFVTDLLKDIQLGVWAERAKVRIVKHEDGSDPAAVIFDAVSSAKARGTDVVLIDTAGRLHVKDNLMKELQKMDRVVRREWQEAQFLKYLVLDATTGQNAVSQAKIFDEAVELDGIVLTKLDGTAKGGFVFSLCGELKIPVVFVGVGEKMDDLELFDAEQFVEGFF